MIQLSKFRKVKNGKGFFITSIWYVINYSIFNSWLPIPSFLKVGILKVFGAQIGKGVVIKPRVRIKCPWNLLVGHFVWIGEDVWIDNVDLVKIGNNVCVSQGVLIINGNHNFNSISFDLFTKPIEIGDGSWITAKSTLLAGTIIEPNTMLKSGTIASGILTNKESL